MPNVAAWIEGVDLTQPFSDAVAAELRQALWDFEVIFFHPQAITPQQHVAPALVFGPPSAGASFERKPGAPELGMIVSDRERPPGIFVNADFTRHIVGVHRHKALADRWPHHRVNQRVNQRVRFDVPGTALAAANVNQMVLNGC